MSRSLKKEQEVAIAKRIEWGLKRAEKGITRSPIAIAELLEIGEELNAGALAIRDVVTFSDQMETEEQDDKAPEYLQWTLEGIQNVRKLYRRALKELGQLRDEQKRTRAKTSKKLLRLKNKLAVTRLEIAQEIRGLRLKEESQTASHQGDRNCAQGSSPARASDRELPAKGSRQSASKAPEAEQLKRSITAAEATIKGDRDSAPCAGYRDQTVAPDDSHRRSSGLAGQARIDRSKLATGRLDCQEISESWLAVPGSDSGGKPRPDEGRRKV